MGFEVKHIKVHSNKYNIDGEIQDAGMVITLSFFYKNREITIGLEQGITVFDTYENLGERMINTYIENLQKQEGNAKVMLYHWYMDENEHEGHKYKVLHGNVTGHKRLSDSTFIHTSPIVSYEINRDTGEFIAQTLNTLYHCPLRYMRFGKQKEKDPEKKMFPDIEQIKEQYEREVDDPEIEPGNVLLVLSNFDEYYFHSLYYKADEKTERESFRVYPHVGMFQDSFLIQSESIDLRYFPHYRNIEFYSEDTKRLPWYVENIGDTVLYCDTSVGQIRLDPHTRKQVCKENVENKEVALPGGDSYPAAFISDTGDDED